MYVQADIDDATNSLKTESARSLVAERYFRHPLLQLQGVDGIGQQLDASGHLVGLKFPDRYAARRREPDMQSTLHEMGHFVTLPPHRIVRAGFGFAGGIPELDWEYWRDTHVTAVSHVHEATAFAWEHILLEQLFAIRIPVRDIVSSLRYAPDFLCYPGNGERERLDWVSGITTEKVGQFRAGPAFDVIWAERLKILPDLISAENERMAALDADAVEESDFEPVHLGWKASIGKHQFGTTIAWRTTLKEDGTGEQLSRDFDTRSGAEKWITSIRLAFAD